MIAQIRRFHTASTRCSPSCPEKRTSANFTEALCGSIRAFVEFAEEYIRPLSATLLSSPPPSSVRSAHDSYWRNHGILCLNFHCVSVPSQEARRRHPRGFDATVVAWRSKDRSYRMAERTDHARSSPSSNPVRVRFDRFELDEVNARLLRDGTAVALPPTPFAVLCALVRQPGSLLTTNALLDEVWGHQFVTDSVLRTAISELRTALDDDARKPRFIETVSRRGYRFVAAPSAISAAPSVQPNVSGLATVRTPHFIGRAEPLSRLRRAWDIACSGKRAIVWIAGEPGIGKTTLIEQFIASLGDVACAHGQCVEHYGTGEPIFLFWKPWGSFAAATTASPLLRAVAPTWLLQLPWLSTRKSEKRCVESSPASARIACCARWASSRSLRRAPPAVAGDRGPALERPRDDPAHRLHRAAPRQRAADVACKLSSRRGRGARSSAQPVAARAAPARLVRGDRARSVLRKRGRRLRGGTSPAIATDEAFVRALHERTDGLPLSSRR